MKAVLTVCDFKGSGSTNNKAWHRFALEFNGGIAGSFICDTNPPIFAVGQELEFDVVPAGKYTNIKNVSVSGIGSSPGKTAVLTPSSGKPSDVIKAAALQAAVTIVATTGANDVEKEVLGYYNKFLIILR